MTTRSSSTTLLTNGVELPAVSATDGSVVVISGAPPPAEVTCLPHPADQ
jgi:hypothetical protein